MAELYDGLVSWSARSWPLLLNHLWQSTLFVLVLAPAILLLRRAPARVRYSLSLLAAGKFLLPSALLFVLLVRLVPDLESRIPAPSFLSLDLGRLLGIFQPASAGAPAPGSYQQVYLTLTAVWLAGVAAFVTVWWRRQRAFRRTLAGARVVTEGPEARLLDAVRRRLGLRRPVTLALLPGGVEPGVCRVWRPLLVMPEEMPRHLTAEELETLFLHELIHVRRWDNLTAHLQMLLCCLFWFHPLVWLLDRRLLAEREEACDEGVLEVTGGAEPYIRSLLKAVRFGIGWRLAGVSSAHASNFRRRIERMRGGDLGRRASLLHRGLVAAVAVALIAFTVGAATSAWEGVPGCAAQQKAERCRLERSHSRSGAAAEPRLELPAPPPPQSDCDGRALPS